MTNTAHLAVPASDLRRLREALCRAETGSGALHRAVLGSLIDEIDRHRPLGPDGTHGDRHTATCGCEDAPATEPPKVQHVETPAGYPLVIRVPDDLVNFTAEVLGPIVRSYSPNGLIVIPESAVAIGIQAAGS